jgi:hypothetical protein
MSEYFEYPEININAKSSLPNDSWHYQVQLQQTIQTTDENNKNLDLDLATFKTEK